MKKLSKLLFDISSILFDVAGKIQDLSNPKEEFYVYVPSRNKPKYKHSNFARAKEEANRLAENVSVFEKIEVLQVVYKQDGYVPF